MLETVVIVPNTRRHDVIHDLEGKVNRIDIKHLTNI
jgi:hypothetical protein